MPRSRSSLADSESSSPRKLLGRVALRRSKVTLAEPERRRSVVEAYRLVSTIGQAEEHAGWEVEVTRALVVSSLFPNKEGSLACADSFIDTRSASSDACQTQFRFSQDTHLVHDYHHHRSSKIPQLRRDPLASLSNTLNSMLPPAHPSTPTNAANNNNNNNRKAKGTSSTRPVVTPRRAATTPATSATTSSFSSIPPPKITTQSGSSSFLAPPTLALIEPTPDPSPVTPTARRVHHKSDPESPPSALRGNHTALEVPQVQKSWSSGSGKRKAEEFPAESDTTPPKEQQGRATTFAPEPRTHRASASSHAPSSYRRKRARLSVPPSDSSNPPSRPPSQSAMSSVEEKDGSVHNAKNTGSWSSKKSGKTSIVEGTPHRTTSPSTPHTRANSWSRSHRSQSGGPMNATPGSSTLYQHPHGAPSRRSLSQASIPISALISPHAPSVAHSGTFHMRDPRKPAPVQTTPWSLTLPSPLTTSKSGDAGGGDEGSWVERGGSPLCAWLFFIGFVIFPLWWLSWVVGVPKTRRLSSSEVEKGVVLDDPQLEHDARSWRKRCRVMSGISVVTYIPFIVLVIVFTR